MGVRGLTRHGGLATRPADDPTADDSTADISDPDCLERFAEKMLRQPGHRAGKRGGKLKYLLRKAHKQARVGMPPGRQIGSTQFKESGKPKCVDKVTCTCGVVHRRGSPAYEQHRKYFPELCRRRKQP